MKKLISFLIVLCLTLNLFVVYANSENPWENWTLESGAVVKNGELYIDSVANGTTIVRGKPSVSDNFDVEFKMQVNNFGSSGENSHIEIGTGKHRVYLVISSSKFKYMSKTYQQNGWTNIPFNLDNQMHKFRFIGRKGWCEMHIDDKFVSELDIQTSSQAQTLFVAQNTANLVVKDFKSNPVKSSTSVNEEELLLQQSPAKGFSTEFNDNEDLSDWTLGGSATIHDGVLDLSANNVLTGGTSASKKIGRARNYVFETRVKFVDAGGVALSVDIVTGDYYVNLYIKRSGIGVRNKVNMSEAGFKPVAIDGEWHDFKVETYENGTWAVLSVDGEPVLDWEIPEQYYTTNEIYFGLPALLERPYQVLVDSVRFEPKEAVSISVDTPKENAEYLEGETVRLSASANGDVPYVEYKMYGHTIAKGFAPDYKAEIKKANSGTYVITAEYDDKRSEETVFTVIPSVKADIVAKNGQKNKVNVKLDIYDELKQIKMVNYYVDGIKKAGSKVSPFNTVLSDVTTEAHTIVAECLDKNGEVVYTAKKAVIPKVEGNVVSANFSNEISYRTEGATGTAEVEISNGKHKLYLKHSADKVSYLTSEGMKEYNAPAGEYLIVTDAYAADVYAEGQFIFSYIMPKTDESSKKITEKGLKIKNFKVSIPTEKTNHFVKRDFKVSDNGLYAIPSVKYDYNLDFILCKGENIKVGVADGYYNLNLEILDGKIYAVEVDRAGRVPERRHLADVPECDKAYFRVENAAGMARLYADGKWLTTIGNPRSTSTKQILIETNSTTGLEYIAVSDNSDLFVYNETFDEKGEIDELDYFVINDLTYTVDSGAITLETVGDQSGRMMTNTSAGDAEVSIDVEVNKARGGVWFVYNKSSLNTYSKAGYNFETKEFEIINSVLEGETKYTVKGNLPVGKKINLSLKVDREHDKKTATLYVNGKPVINDANSTISYGAIGVELCKASAKIYDFKYRGDSKPMAGMKTRELVGSSITYNLVEFDDQWVLMNDSRRLYSADEGDTWTVEYTTSSTGEMNGDSRSTITLPSGEKLSISCSYIYQGTANNPDPYDRLAHNYRVCSSTDGGKTWNEITWIFDEARNGDVTCNRLRQDKTGRLYYAIIENMSEEEGSVQVCYSDDNGRTWEFGPEISFADIGIMCQETELLPMPDGKIRLYVRNETGMLQYIVSEDRGETWDYTPHKTSLYSVLSHFNIEMDPYEEGTYWAVYQYSNRNADARPQRPRTRVALSKSTDGCETWEFMGTLYEFDVENFIKLRGSDNHMMNINVNATKDHIIATLPIKREDQSSYVNRIVTIRKDMLKPVIKPENIHAMPGRVDTNKPVNYKKFMKTLVISPDKQTAMVNSKIVTQAIDGGAISLDAVVDFLGWNIEKSVNDTAVLRYGDAFVECNVKNINNKPFVPIEELVDKFSLELVEKEGYMILSPYDNWTWEQINSFKNSLNPFNN